MSAILSLLPILAVLLLGLSATPQIAPAVPASPPSSEGAKTDLFAIDLKTLEGEGTSLAPHRGKVLLLVNVASKCGYTPQYAELERLHQRFKDQGLVIIGFPSNDFGGQEPGSSQEIRDFCTRQYAVTFPLMEKVQTKAGAGQSLIYDILESRTGKVPSWNFCKYLVGRDGTTTTFFESKVRPTSDEMVKAIEAALAQGAAVPPAAPPAAPAAPAPKAPRSSNG